MNESSAGVNPAELAQKIENLQVIGGPSENNSEKLFGSGAVSPMAGMKVILNAIFDSKTRIYVE